jgi:hypothetical protein
MNFQIDFLFRSGAGYDDLIELIQGNPRYVFTISKQDRIDKRTKKAKEKGWVELSHKQYKEGVIKLFKNQGICRASVTDDSGGLRLIGAWISWLASNASELLAGLDVRIVSR